MLMPQRIDFYNSSGGTIGLGRAGEGRLTPALIMDSNCSRERCLCGHETGSQHIPNKANVMMVRY